MPDADLTRKCAAAILLAAILVLFGVFNLYGQLRTAPAVTDGVEWADTGDGIIARSVASAPSPLRIAARLALPLRHEDARVQYCGDFYGQSAEGYACPEQISVNALVEILRRLPRGVTELGCHPGEAGDLDTMYRDERAAELSALCDERTRATVAASGIELCSFHRLT